MFSLDLKSKSKSSATATTTIDTITNVIMQSIQSCPIIVKQSQTLNLSGSNVTISNTKMVQNVSISASCLQDAIRSSKTTADISAAIKQNVESQTSGLSLPSTSKSELVTSLTQRVLTNIDLSSIADCTINLTQDQAITVDRNATNLQIKGLYMEQMVDLTRDCISKTLASNENLANVAVEIDSYASATVENPISDIVDSVASFFSTTFIIIVVIVLFVIFMFKDEISNFILGRAPAAKTTK